MNQFTHFYRNIQRQQLFWGICLRFGSSIFLTLSIGTLFAFSIAHQPALSAPNHDSSEVKDSERILGLITPHDFLEKGRNFYNAGQFAHAVESWTTAYQSFFKQGDRASQALSLSYLSLAYQSLNNWEAAEDTINQSLALLNDMGEPSGTQANVILKAQAWNTQGSLRLHQGQPEEALALWEQSESYYAQAGDEAGVLGSQLNQARAFQYLGFYRRARLQIQDIVTKLASLPPSSLKSSHLRSLAIAYEASGSFSESQSLLEESLKIAQQLNLIQEINTTQLMLGSVLLEQDRWKDAHSHFETVERVATTNEDRHLAQLGRLDLFIRGEQWDLAQSLVEELLPSLERQIDRTPGRSVLDQTVRLVNHALTIRSKDEVISAVAVTQLLMKALSASESLGDDRSTAILLDTMSQIYAQVGQEREAIALAQRSLTLAQRLEADDITALSAWHLGKLQVQQGQQQRAIATYFQAVDALEELRSELVSVNPELQLSFRNGVEPIYRELITLLLPRLQDSAESADPQNLERVRYLMESLQLAELDNFFRESCLDSESVLIDQIDPQVTTFYSIILNDRLAVIVAAPKQPIRYFAVARSRAEVEATVKDFMRHLSPAYDNRERLRLSQKLYDWLVRPAHESGVLDETETLVFVLDGLLRNTPISALHDGHQYLVQQYNFALSPGLQLLRTEPFQSEDREVVVGGVSEARQGLRSLPAVKQEVDQIAQRFSSKVLLNQDFTSQTLAKQFRENSATVFHLATHGQFSSQADQTFLLTWDQRLSIHSLSELLQRRQESGLKPIELFILSACETAIGDERAVLGLAGISAKAGVRSVLATLWQVSDDSTAVFMAEFYRQLQRRDVTKVSALRQAQLSLLQHPSYGEPFYWAPFTLIGNWR